MKLKLWSIQESYKLQEIESEGRLICLENKFSQDWDDEYKWMAKQMSVRLGKSEFENQYPIWSWYQYFDSKRPKPDLRLSAHLPRGTKAIRIEFEKSPTDVLLSDFIMWHFPLSYKSFIGNNRLDDNQFERNLKKLGLHKTEFAQLPEPIKTEIEMSWYKIFDMEFTNKDYTNAMAEKKIQACCWEIRKEEIIEITEFIAK
ncbi:MAG: DUF3841 domain-containing protein [Saprospiraceae bacterium]